MCTHAAQRSAVFAQHNATRAPHCTTKPRPLQLVWQLVRSAAQRCARECTSSNLNTRRHRRPTSSGGTQLTPALCSWLRRCTFSLVSFWDHSPITNSLFEQDFPFCILNLNLLLMIVLDRKNKRLDPEDQMCSEEFDILHRLHSRAACLCH